jgi:hypothetical protein
MGSVFPTWSCARLVTGGRLRPASPGIGIAVNAGSAGAWRDGDRGSGPRRVPHVARAREAQSRLRSRPIEVSGVRRQLDPRPLPVDRRDRPHRLCE